MAETVIQNEMHTPVCAIGASAGGVTALQNFFANVRDDLGLAFIVIVHLSPAQPSALRDILATRTRMPVSQVENTVELIPNSVYVIPPDRELVLKGDSLTAQPFAEPRGHRAPIDTLFQSVASGRGDGMAVLLSGTGSDGTLGVRAVKGAGGVIFAQDPAEAEYGSMPESAISTGVVDFVAPVAALGKQIEAVMSSKEALRRTTEEETEQELRQIIALVRLRTSHDFTSYKRATLMRRIARRMQVTRQESLSSYNQYLHSHQNEIGELFSDLLISVTMFFRDPEAFDALAEKVVKPLFDRLDDKGSLRIWVVGCATGEEAYSIGMLLLEEANRRRVAPVIQIFATDIDEAALAAAREGRYPKAIEASLSEKRLNRFFIQDGAYYRVKQELRDLVLFAAHSALKDPPFIRVDLISCRNLLIYLQRELQRQLCAMFHYALKPNGYVFLGSAETMDTTPTLFAPVDREARIYAALALAERFVPILPQVSVDHRLLEQLPKQRLEIEAPLAVGHTHASALEQHAPPSALVNSGFHILHLSPTVGRFFKPQEGPFSSELPAQVRPELRIDLKLALQRAFEKGEPTLTVAIPVQFNGDRGLVSMHVIPTGGGEQASIRHALVFFLDAGPAQAADATGKEEPVSQQETARLRQELAAAQDRLSSGRKEYEQATQDLRATNEELQSINEEYRSTAEELETSKEELQSMNEELQTVNSELKSKLGTISAAHNNLQNLITATEIGALFLDLESRIKLFTPPMTRYFNITEADIGRAISNFTSQLEYGDLTKDTAYVLKTLEGLEKELKTTDGQWLLMRMRPYRTLENKIEGVVITLADVTRVKSAEEGLAAELRAMTRLQQLSTKVVAADKLEEPLGAILDAMIELLNANFGHIQLYEERSQTLHLAAQRGFDQGFLERITTVEATAATACGLSLAKCQQVVFEDVNKDPAFNRCLDEAKAGDYRGLIANPLCDSAGKLVGVLAIHFREAHHFSPHDRRLVDIGARLASDALTAYLLQRALREADRRKDEFIAMLGHELRNPLAAGNNALQTLKRIDTGSGEVARLHAIIERQFTKLLRLVDDLLDVARITQGKIELRKQRIDINDLLRQIVDGESEMIHDKGQKLDVLLPSGSLDVDGDPMRLSQVFLNLLNNASKFTPPGGWIKISAEREGDRATITVRDNGIGIPIDKLPHIFELFNQVERPGQPASGIGVGLALARNIIELHGGAIEGTSEGLEKGCEFRIILPLATAPRG